MDYFDYLGETETPVKKIKSQLIVKILEGRHYCKSNVNTYVVVEIPSYFNSKTATRKASSSPSYFKVITI